ncbi:sulfatase-like hydrolase/transferase [Salegentibacter sp. F14]
MKIFLAVLCVIALSGDLKAQNHEQTPPNVIVINADDVGYGDVGVYGASKVKTPNIDQLAHQGRRFNDFHSASAVCSPSRYALLTGEYPARKDFFKAIFLKNPLTIDTEKVTVADIMKEAGYATAVIGKWHLGFGNERPVNWNRELKPGPLELGFDYYYGVPVLNSHPPFVYVENYKVLGLTSDDPMVYDENAETRWFPEKWDMDAIGGGRKAHNLYDDRSVGTNLKNKAVEFIEEKKDEAFFLYFATTNIHHPFTPASRFIGTSDAGRYGDFMHELDWIVGEIMKTLDQEGLADNTILIFTSDNGGMLNYGGQDAYRAGHKLNADLLGFKFDAWEGGHRVPFIVRWPGKIPAGSISNELASNVDIFATLAALTKRKLRKGEGNDSFNLLPALIDSPEKPIRDHLLMSSATPHNFAYRKGDWVYINGQGGGGFGPRKEGGRSGFGGPSALLFADQKNSDIEKGKIKKDAPPAQLYNLKVDPSQEKNVFREYPDVVKQLKRELEEIKNLERTRP